MSRHQNYINYGRHRVDMSEQCPILPPPIEYIVPDELDEATPQFLRPLKRILDAKVRRKAEKAAMCLGRLRNF